MMIYHASLTQSFGSRSLNEILSNQTSLSTRFVTGAIPGLKPVQVAAVREMLIGLALIVVLRVRPAGVLPERLPRARPA